MIFEFLQVSIIIISDCFSIKLLILLKEIIMRHNTPGCILLKKSENEKKTGYIMETKAFNNKTHEPAKVIVLHQKDPVIIKPAKVIPMFS